MEPATVPPEEPYDEIVVLCGNPGVGKNTLRNSIFQEAIFSSGLSLGTGLTTVKQQHIYKDILYTNTPGLADISFRQQAAKQITKAFKVANNYKIVFVVNA